MKRIERLYRTALLLALLGMAAGCTRDDDPDAIAPDTSAATTLTVSVSDGGYSPSPETTAAPDAPDTRAVDNGFATEFTAGDCIGLYVAEVEVNADGTPTAHKRMVHKNLCLTYNGTEWKLPDGELKHTIPAPGCEIRYYAYYPYQTDMTSKEPDGTTQYGSIANTDTEFFWKLIDQWNPQNNQSTYAAYTASDLMTAQGVVTPRTGNTAGSTLSFTMQHRMNLVIIRLPHTTYNYKESIGGTSFDKSYSLYIGASSGVLWKENHYTARYILSPMYALVTSGSFYNSDFKECKYSTNMTSSPFSSGKYKLYTIGGGAEMVKTDRPLREGDFYMKDGTILPQEAFNNGTTIPPEVKADCIGVVFWVGEKTEKHWTQTTGNKEGDRLLMYNHPACTHGMVVALHDASSSSQWGSATPKLWAWAEGFNEFTDNESARWKMIYSSSFRYGYCNSALIDLYANHNGDAVFHAYQAVKDYAKANATPKGCSGWFFPSYNELATMFFGVPTGFAEQSSPYYYRSLYMLNIINPQIGKADGNQLDGKYWSCCNETSESAWHIDSSRPTYSDWARNEHCKVRAVLAF